MRNRTYLDHAATSPMRRAAIEAMTRQLSRVGNPSSLHGSGRDARRVLEESRELIADRLGADPAEIIFTSGATEADNLMIKGAVGAQLRSQHSARVITSAVEHHAVLDPAQALARADNVAVELIGVDADGQLDLDQLRTALAADDVACVSIMWANNETGVLQPIPEIARIASGAGTPVHSDGVQAAGKVRIDFHASGLDALSVTAHKFGGPVGVGALVARRDLELDPLQHGGGQERDVRSGTLDVPGVAGFAAALDAATADLEAEAGRLAGLRGRLIDTVLGTIDDAALNGVPDAAQALPTIANLSFPGCQADDLLLLLDQSGIDCSTGSACSAGVSQGSHVLEAMGRSGAQAGAALRFSLGHSSTGDDVDQLLRVLPEAVRTARRAGGLAS